MKGLFFGDFFYTTVGSTNKIAVIFVDNYY
jgi:hypothetical protein